MAISAALNEASLLALIACDASYDRSRSVGSILSSFPDSSPEVDLPPISAFSSAGIDARMHGQTLQIDGWKMAARVDDQGTGFHAQIYQSDDKSKIIVAFSGTNGRDYQDWWTNANLGVVQWSAVRDVFMRQLQSVLQTETGSFEGEVVFTGQSLGGALAAYGLEEYQRSDPNFNAARTRLITFNGLGGLDGRQTLFNSAVQDPIANVETAHFIVRNDIVARLGGGHINGASSMYRLNFYATGELEAVPPASGQSYAPAATRALGLWEAHRIESGFYRGLPV
jgi:hypothetical protein